MRPLHSGWSGGLVVCLVLQEFAVITNVTAEGIQHLPAACASAQDGVMQVNKAGEAPATITRGHEEGLYVKVGWDLHGAFEVHCTLFASQQGW